METNQDGTHHLHLMLEFLQKKDCSARGFAFDGRCPQSESE